MPISTYSAINIDTSVPNSVDPFKPFISTISGLPIIVETEQDRLNLSGSGLTVLQNNPPKLFSKNDNGWNLIGEKNEASSQTPNQFIHTITTEEYKKAAKFTFGKTIPLMYVGTSGASHVKLLRWDGEYVVLSTSSAYPISTGSWGAPLTGSYGTTSPKFCAVMPCDSTGSIVGDLINFVSTNNTINSIDIEGLGELVSHEFYNMYITEIGFVGTPKIEGNLVLSGNRIKKFDCKNLPIGVLSLDLSNNPLIEFKTSGGNNVVSIWLNNAGLKTFKCDTAGDLDLVGSLRLNNNPLHTLDLSYLTNLNELHVDNCELTSINIHQNIEYLTADNNMLSGSLDLTNMINCTHCSLDNNSITSIEPPSSWIGCSQGETGPCLFDIKNNNLSTQELQNVYDKLVRPICTDYPNDPSYGAGTIQVYGNPNSGSADSSRLTSIGWTVSHTP